MIDKNVISQFEAGPCIYLPTPAWKKLIQSFKVHNSMDHRLDKLALSTLCLRSPMLAAGCWHYLSHDTSEDTVPQLYVHTNVTGLEV